MQENNLPAKNVNYGEVNYWEERYEKEDFYDWFIGYEELKDLITKYVPVNHSVLNLGCGNSRLPLEMQKNGYQKIVNVDNSSVVIDNMKEMCRGIYGLHWLVCDVKDLNKLFLSNSYDVVIEKGTFDTLLVGETNQWCYSPEAEDMIGGILEAISQILRPGGSFISVTFAQPHFRSPLYSLKRYGWSVVWETVGEGFEYFVYVMTKGESLTEQNLQYRNSYLERKKNRILNLKCQENQIEDDEDDFIFNISDTIMD